MVKGFLEHTCEIDPYKEAYNGVVVKRGNDGLHFNCGNNPSVSRLPSGIVPNNVVRYSYEEQLPNTPPRTCGVYELRSATATLMRNEKSGSPLLILDAVELQDLRELYEQIRGGTAGQYLKTSFEATETPRPTD